MHARTMLLGCLALACLFGACGSETASPEMQVRAVLDQAEDAAEARDLRALRDLISASYTDERGQDKQAVMGLLQFYFLQTRSVYLLTKVEALTFPEPDRAEVRLLIGMAGRPIEDDAALLRADVYRFDLTLTEEGAGDWKVARAAWQRAAAY